MPLLQGDSGTYRLPSGPKTGSGGAHGWAAPGLLPMLLLAWGCAGQAGERSPEGILSLRGDFERCRDLVFESALGCRGCHRFGTGDDRVGPDLGTIGAKYDRRKLLAKLQNPSQGIDPKYVSFVVETRAGSIQSGILLERSAERIVLRDPEKIMTFELKEVRRMAAQEKSMMPDSLLKDLSDQTIADLLEFLTELK